MDFRPALLSETGIGRVARELALCLPLEKEIEEMKLFGHSLARARIPISGLHEKARLYRFPLPGRIFGSLARLGITADVLLDGCSTFLWTDYVFPPVGKAMKAMILHDLAFLEDPSFHGSRSKVLGEKTREALSMADLVFVPSSLVERQALELFPFLKEKVRVVPWGGEHSARDYTLSKYEKRIIRSLGLNKIGYFMFLGRIEPRKDVGILLSAFSMLKERRKDLVLLVAGPPGWDTEGIRQRLEDSRDKGIIWMRNARDPLLFRLLKGSVCLVYPSRYEGFGLPVAEALHLGVPSITAEGTAPRYLAGDGGLCFRPGDAEGLFKAMERILTEKELAVDLGRRALKRSSLFSWNICAKRISKALADLERRGS